MALLSSRIPLQIAAPKNRGRGHIRSAALFVVLASAAVATTTLRQGAAHAERPGASRPLQQILTALPARAALTTVADVEKELNARREAKGLPALTFDDWMLGPTAQKWAESMAADGNVRHDPKLVGDYQDVWRTLSESVAAGGSTDAAFETVLADRRQAAHVFDASTTTAGIGLATTADGAEAFLVMRFVA